MYVEWLLHALAAAGREVAFWTETDEPGGGQLVTIPGSTQQWCAGADGLVPCVTALERWSPSVLLVNGLVDPRIESRLLRVAPAALIAHTYYGTCISGGKTLTFPTPRPCDRIFGPACLAMFYPRRCGGLSPATLARDYRRQRRRLALLQSYVTIMTLSEHMRLEYVRHGLGSSTVRTLPPFLPECVISNPVPRITREAVSLLFLGRLHPLKGCRLLIEALPLVRRRLQRPVHLIVAGEGPDRAECERVASSIAEADVHVEFKGWLEGTRRSDALADADVLVMPSIWPEPYGLSGLEAVLAGVPVAAFRSGGVPEWLHKSNGRLAPSDPPTASGLAEAISECVTLVVPSPTAPSTIQDARMHHVATLLSSLDAVARRLPPS